MKGLMVRSKIIDMKSFKPSQLTGGLAMKQPLSLVFGPR